MSTTFMQMLLIVAALAVAVPVSVAQQVTSTVTGSGGVITAERPELKIGDRWGYNFNGNNPYDLTVQSVDADGKSTSVWKDRDSRGKSGTSIRDKNMNPIGPYRETYLTFDFPLSVGKTETSSYEVTDSNGDVWYNKVTRTVVAFEKRTVPAGTFDTFKVVTVRTYNMSNQWGGKSGTVTDTLWYAPEVRNFVERVIDTQIGKPVVRQLLDFSLRK